MLTKKWPKKKTETKQCSKVKEKQDHKIFKKSAWSADQFALTTLWLEMCTKKTFAWFTSIFNRCLQATAGLFQPKITLRRLNIFLLFGFSSFYIRLTLLLVNLLFGKLWCKHFSNAKLERRQECWGKTVHCQRFIAIEPTHFSRSSPVKTWRRWWRNVFSFDIYYFEQKTVKRKETVCFTKVY